jgi:hypothetical protein
MLMIIIVFYYTQEERRSLKAELTDLFANLPPIGFEGCEFSGLLTLGTLPSHYYISRTTTTTKPTRPKITYTNNFSPSLQQLPSFPKKDHTEGTLVLKQTTRERKVRLKSIEHKKYKSESQNDILPQSGFNNFIINSYQIMTQK